jgi:pimeloyl-ACP methyl ester carboxylesterase
VKILSVLVAILVLLLVAVWLKLRGPDIPYANLEAKYTNLRSHFVDLPGGVHLHYEDTGEAGLPILVLLHGFGDSYTTWDGWVRALQGQYRLISLDFPGHGLTRAPAGYRLSGATLADLVDAFAGALALPRFAVAGNSMGGNVAWQLAVRHPERLDALILVDAAGWPAEKPPAKLPLAFKILKYPLGRALLRNIDNRPLIDEGLKKDVYDPGVITPAFVDRWAELQRAPGHRAILMDIDIGGLAAATPALLGGIRLPTLVINGANDILVEPESAHKFAAAIAGAELIIYPRVGHLPQIEIPERSAADVAAFLRAHAAAVPAVDARR